MITVFGLSAFDLLRGRQAIRRRRIARRQQRDARRRGLAAVSAPKQEMKLQAGRAPRIIGNYSTNCLGQVATIGRYRTIASTIVGNRFLTIFEMTDWRIKGHLRSFSFAQDDLIETIVVTYYSATLDTKNPTLSD
ncbi:hypothetical protein [Pontibacter burrus]|uniref:Uncharacterized protein n=1 Tax=Pontibacter burrus TaxID=2704466 RepID=A0A6B3LR12_9BACT|nr:hypothetical protein [Pontibacter burrus]NEM98283.1 hypothetical protein [Pontibacter burrus]